ncbi:cytochrome P450 2U1-like [Diadema setosum]|uniref:cytochrome P450 2U1-like n=1 Tax=Diadema setosum TaxID=31175 RepID=UPI003B3A0481
MVSEVIGNLLIVDSTTFLISFAVFLVCIYVSRQLFRTRYEAQSAMKLPPSGPRTWPVIGCMPSLIGDEPQKLFAKMSEKFGPVFYTRIGVVPTLILNDFSSMREAFSRSGDDFADRPKLGMMEYITKGRGIISAHVGENQRERRRFGLAALRSLGMGKSRLIENIVSEIETLSDLFTSRKSEPFVPFHDLNVSVSNIISWIVFGQRFKHDDIYFKQFLDIIHEGLEISETTGVTGFIPVLQYLPLPVWRKLANNHRKWQEFDSAMIKDALNRPESEEPCFVQMYMEELKRVQGEKACNGNPPHDGSDGSIGPSTGGVPFSEDDLRQTLGDLFVAGTDTTATTLMWAILYLVLHPDVQRKVHEELDRAIGPDRMPTLEQRKDIPYTEAVLMEVQRMATIVPLAVPHASTCDTKLFDFDIPAGTLVLPNLWAVHYDPKTWKNPEEFVPERFLNEDRTAVIQRDEFIPFCIGRRKCLGEQLAKMELYFFFTHLLHRFEFRLPEGAPRPSTVGKVGATRIPMPYQVCAIPRNP